MKSVGRRRNFGGHTNTCPLLHGCGGRMAAAIRPPQRLRIRYSLIGTLEAAPPWIQGLEKIKMLTKIWRFGILSHSAWVMFSRQQDHDPLYFIYIFAFSVLLRSRFQKNYLAFAVGALLTAYSWYQADSGTGGMRLETAFGHALGHWEKQTITTPPLLAPLH